MPLFIPAEWDFRQDLDSDCMSTRHEILADTSRVPVGYTTPRRCAISSGEWLDQYSGRVFRDADRLDVDHIIPLSYAHRNGGAHWGLIKKLQFANDPLNIMLVAHKEIRRKKARGPDRYLPRRAFRCQYVRLWLVISDKYDLQIEPQDQSQILRTLRRCN